MLLSFQSKHLINEKAISISTEEEEQANNFGDSHHNSQILSY